MNTPIKWYALYVRLGRILYMIATPLRWLLLSHTHRGYAVLENDSRILLVKNWFSDGSWSLPGGGIHGWERAVDGVRRELHEEIGARVSNLDFLHEGFKKERFGGKHYMLYHATFDDVGDVRINRREIVAFRWQPLTSVDTLQRTEEVDQALKAMSQNTV